MVNRNEPHVYVRVFYGSGTGAVKKIFLYEVLRGQAVFDWIWALASESAPGLKKWYLDFFKLLCASKQAQARIISLIINCQILKRKKKNICYSFA